MQCYRFPFKAMGSPCLLCFYAPSQIEADSLFRQVYRRVAILEKRYSRFLPDSLISEINRTAGSGRAIPIDAETVALLNYAEQCYAESDGLFDVTSGILRQAWRFHEQQKYLPDAKEIAVLIDRIDWHQLIWDEQTARLALPGMELDFGGIVKEYAADSVASLCYERNIQHGFINMGGDIRVFGPALGENQSVYPWPITIRHPFDEQSHLAQIPIKSGAVASSGDYERVIEMNGKRYSHLLNPQTGQPVSGLSAVTVIADHCVVAGSLCTIAMLKGEQGVEWLQATGAMFIACDNEGNPYQNQI